MNPSDFYAAKPARRSSDEVRLGDVWTRGEPGATYSLFWIKDTGELCAVSGPNLDTKVPGSLGPWGTGGASLTDVSGNDIDIEVVGQIASEVELRRLMDSGEVQGFTRADGDM